MPFIALASGPPDCIMGRRLYRPTSQGFGKRAPSMGESFCYQHPYGHWGHCPSWPCALTLLEQLVGPLGLGCPASMHRWLQGTSRAQSGRMGSCCPKLAPSEVPQKSRGPNLSRVTNQGLGQSQPSYPLHSPLTGGWELHPGPRSTRSSRTSPVAPR